MHLHRFATIDASAPSTGSTRIVSVDLLRGLVMMLMALDHTRDYFSGLPYAPEDLSKTFGALFFTRVITHICAPVFFLLAGAGAYLAVARGKSLQQVSRFFWTRGLWLVFLEVTVLRIAWNFTFASAPFVQVIWALVPNCINQRKNVSYLADGLRVWSTRTGLHPGSSYR